jgi:single-strand DNA-binding protein
MYQKIIFVGNLGDDPELRYTPTGSAVTNFSVAVNRRYTGSDGQKIEEKTWFRVAAWGRQAETCKAYLQRGSRVLVEGRLNPDKQSGAPRLFQRQNGSWGASYEVVAQSVQFLSPRGEDEAFDPDGNTGDLAPEGDDIPF